MKRKRKYNNEVTPRFRSNLEHFTWHELTRAKLDFEYEPKRFILVPAFTWEGTAYEKRGKRFTKVTNKLRTTEYIPDFVGSNWIIETKGVRTAAFNIKWKLFKLHLMQSGLNYHLFVPSNKEEVRQTIEHILDINS